MATLSLRISIPEKNATKMMQFDPSTSVYDACRIIREKLAEASNMGQRKCIQQPNRLYCRKIFNALFLRCTHFSKINISFSHEDIRKSYIHTHILFYSYNFNQVFLISLI